jgi:hypothetical protein
VGRAAAPALASSTEARHHAQFNNSLLLDPDVMGTLVTGTDTVKIQGAGNPERRSDRARNQLHDHRWRAGGSCQKDFNVSILSPPVTRTYTAVPRGGHAFAGWSGACSGTAPARARRRPARSPATGRRRRSSIRWWGRRLRRPHLRLIRLPRRVAARA